MRIHVFHQALWERSGCEYPALLFSTRFHVPALGRRGPNVMKCYWRDPGENLFLNFLNFKF